MKPFCTIVALAASFSAAAPVLAQATGAMDPPSILKITKLVAKPGKLGALVKLEQQRADALETSNWPRTAIPSVSVTGPAQIWILSRYDSLDDLANDDELIAHTPALKSALERIDNAESEVLESRRDVSATYQKDISYRPAFDWAEVRYWEIIWVHLRTGHHEAYIENRLMTRDEHEKGAYDTHQMMYAIQSGEPSGTFLVIRPMKSLALLDDLHAHNDGEPVTRADERRKVQLFAESGMSEEEAYFRVDPKMTHFPKR